MPIAHKLQQSRDLDYPELARRTPCNSKSAHRQSATMNKIQKFVVLKLTKGYMPPGRKSSP